MAWIFFPKGLPVPLNRITIVVLACILYAHNAGCAPPELFTSTVRIHRNALKIAENTGLMIQDQDGFLWFGTNGSGLYRYDGINLKPFKTGPGSISDNYIFALFEDREGIIWIGTRNGLNKYDKHTDTFTVYHHNPDNASSISDDVFAWGSRSIWEDTSGAIWVGTMKGLNRLDKTTGKFTRYFHDPGNPVSLGSNAIYAGLEDRNQVIWVATLGGGLNRLDRATGQFTRFVHDPGNPDSISDNHLMSIIEDRDGLIWVGTKSGGLNRFDRHSETFKRFVHDPEDPLSISHNNILSIYEDRQGLLWFTRYDVSPFGLECYDKKNGQFRVYHHDPQDPYSLSSDLVFGIFEDRAGTLWIIHLLESVDKIDRYGSRFDVFRHHAHNPNSISANAVVRVFEDSREQIWVGPFGTGIDRLDPVSGLFTRFPPEKSPSGIQGMATYVPAIFEDRDGTFWLGNFGGTLSRFDPLSGQVLKTYSHDPGNPQSLAKHSQLNHICQDIKRSDTLWLGAYGAGLVKFNKTEESFARYSLSANEMWMLIQDREGIIWIPTLGGGLDRFDPATENLTNFRHDPDNPATLSSNSLNFVYEDPAAQILWIGGTAGLDKFDKQNGRVLQRYTQFSGYNIDGVMTITGDLRGNLWMGTGSGLVRFTPPAETVKTYREGDGIPGNRFNFMGVTRGRNGKIWFGNYNGLLGFFPDDLQDNNHIPPIVLTALNQGGVPLISGIAPEKIGLVELDWRHNFFEFEYAALNYIQPEKCEFQYMLEGHDQDWFYAGSNRFGRYTHLAGGNYTLKIKGSNNDGVWNEKGLQLQIRVATPFWKTTWFYMILACGFTGFGFFCLLYLVRLKSEIKERKKTQQALRLHHERFLTIMDSIDATIYVSDLDTNRVLFMNEQMKKEFGRDLTGETCHEVFRNRSKPCEHCTNKRLLDENGFPKGVMVWQDKNPVTGRWYNNYDRAIKWIDNRYVKLQIATDISNIKHMEKLLRQSQKMEAIGTLAGGIAHDFNNILGAIMGYTELAQINTKNVDAQKKNLASVLKASSRAKDLVNQILTFSRHTEKEFKSVRVDLILKEALKLMRASLPKTIDIQQAIHSNAQVWADPTQIHQIVMNLCTNAGYAMRENGGVLNVILERLEGSDEAITNNPELDAKPHVKLTVSDSGMGITGNDLERIFEPFFTTKDVSEGTGMGLAVVHGIVKTHRGGIQVSSDPGKGTTFEVLLPIVPSKNVMTAPDQDDRTRQRGSEKILFVDDEAMLAEVGAKTLSALGYQVTVCTDSLDALNTFRSQKESIDLLVTDMTMPHMTGDKLAMAIKQIRPDLPVILCTGFNTQVTEKNAMEKGIDHLLIKPVSTIELSDTIRLALDGIPGMQKTDPGQPV
ncbi:MAG: response regulator [Desulfobacteraceae bacterium]|nr:MAG: response regulator [Desulfobacteraceae bacterium]